MERTIPALASILAAGIALTACGGGHSHGAGANSPVAEDARRVEVEATIQGFEPDVITATVGEDLAIELTSTDMFHDFVIDDLDAHVAADRGETAAGGVRVDEPGEYTYYCSVPGHRRAGMEGTLRVSAD